MFVAADNTICVHHSKSLTRAMVRFQDRKMVTDGNRPNQILHPSHYRWQDATSTRTEREACCAERGATSRSFIGSRDTANLTSRTGTRRTAVAWLKIVQGMWINIWTASCCAPWILNDAITDLTGSSLANWSPASC